ncbi:MAG: hypothetical protein OZSIB_1853 [Candidatus Ozemobacter sibiricus]|uniref:Uncharacterized protein n=1 Tax=Candidatus Ozemobacter sibiricus TaxID=2268124 RepID=A0A367ZJP8_9BACT|nr:MAG: hypothetical protein OZSIB_1853 [Candidatus Ozemobacter sibiricus]
MFVGESDDAAHGGWSFPGCRGVVSLAVRRPRAGQLYSSVALEINLRLWLTRG